MLKVDLCFHAIALHNTCSLHQHIHVSQYSEAVLKRKQMTLQVGNMSKSQEPRVCVFLLKYIKPHVPSYNTLGEQRFRNVIGVQRKEGSKINC